MHIVTLDIETENTGYDIMNDNKRIISIQILDDDAKIFYDRSITNNLEIAKKELKSYIDSGTKFLGYNIKNFDVPFLDKFLRVIIPKEQILEISDMDAMEKIRKELNKKRVRLEEACENLGIEVLHKKEMEALSKKFIRFQNVIEKAKEGARKWHEELGWGYDFSYNLALNRIVGGMAILESYNDFVQSQGSRNTIFYRYAIGDVRIENELYHRLLKIESE